MQPPLRLTHLQDLLHCCSALDTPALAQLLSSGSRGSLGCTLLLYGGLRSLHGAGVARKASSALAGVLAVLLALLSQLLVPRLLVQHRAEVPVSGAVALET